jgi:hypothetical protein
MACVNYTGNHLNITDGKLNRTHFSCQHTAGRAAQVQHETGDEKFPLRHARNVMQQRFYTAMACPACPHCAVRLRCAAGILLMLI